MPEKFAAYREGGLFDFGHLSREVEKPSGAGVQPAAGFSPPSWYATNFSGFVSLKRCAAKPEKFVKIRGRRLKAGCRLKGRPTKSQSRDEFLGLRSGMPARPEAGENARTA